MAELSSDISVNVTESDGGCDPLTIVEIMENELISREVLKYLNLTDLKACTLVCQSISYIARCCIRDHFITDANLPPKASPCTALAALESAMDQMHVIQFTGLHIYINECSAHPADSPRIHMADDLHPNIMSRLNLKRLIIKFTTNTDGMCWMATKLIESLLDKHCQTLREMRLDLSCDGIEHELLKLVNGGRIFAKLRKLTLNYCYLNDEKDAVLRKSFYSSFPSLQELSSGSISSIPTEQCRFVKQYLVSSNHWGDSLYHLRRKSGDNFKLDFLNVITTSQSSGPWRLLYGNEMEYLMQQSCDSLRNLIIKGQHFPKFSQLNIPPMINLRNLKIVHSMVDEWFLIELGNLCAMLPVLHSVHIYHSPCHEIVSSMEQLEDESVIVPSVSTSILTVQGLEVEMDILMPILAKYFPNLKELQVFDCDPSAFDYIYRWPELKCLCLGAKSSYWNNNFDHSFIGLTEEEMHQWLDGANVELNPTSLMALKSLMRLYLIGGGEMSRGDPNALLSPLAMSCLLKSLPNLAVRIIPRYNGSVLSHLVKFNNAGETLWCPPYPFDMEALFVYT